jgi:hypothetical protein
MTYTIRFDHPQSLLGRTMPTDSEAIPAFFLRETQPYLRPESLAMSGRKRLQEAAEYFGYTAADVGSVPNEWRHHMDVTPIHEAAHAIAHALEGRNVRDVKVWWFAPSKDKLGVCRLEDHTGQRDAAAEIRFLGTAGALKSIVGSYAGPVAELRYDPRRVHSGLQGDVDYVMAVALALEKLRIYSVGYVLDWCWREACRMFLDERVWAATAEIAARLKQSRSHPARVSGGAVHTIVRKHLPDGWDWPSPPPRMRRRSATV